MAKDFVSKSGLKLSALKTKQKTQQPFGKRKAKTEFPDLRDTDFFNPKSMAMQRGSHLPKRKEEVLPMEFEGLKARSKSAPPEKKKALASKPKSLRFRATEGSED